MRKNTLIATLIVALLFYKCIERERTNPFDPKSSNNLEEVFRLRLTSSEDEIIVSWNPMDKFEYDSTKIYKFKVDDTTNSFLCTFPKGISEWRDREITADKRYKYKMSLLSSGSETYMVESDTIVPGPGFLWVLDSHYRSILLLSYDGAHIYRTFNDLTYPFLMSVIDDSTILVVDYFYKGLIFISPHSMPRRIEEDFGYIRNLAVSIKTGRIVTYEEHDQIAIYTKEGSREQEVSISKKIDWMEIGDRQQILWFGSESDGVYCLDLNNPQIEPMKVDTISSVNGTVIEDFGWCAVCSEDRNTVKIFDSSGFVVKIINFEKPTSLAYDEVNQKLWIAGRGNPSLGSIAIQSSSEVVSSSVMLEYPMGIAVNSRTGELFVADPSLKKVLHLDKKGEKTGEFQSDIVPYPTDLKFLITQ